LELGYGAAYTPGIFRDHEPRSEEFRYDVSFVGIVSGKVGRGEYIRYLRDNGINVHVFGADAQYLTEDEKYAVYRTSKINLSFTYLDEFPELEKDEPDLIRKDNFKGRVFEIISVGAFCLTETSKESALIFDGSSPLAEFRGKEELLESVRFLLSDEKERATISKRCKMIFDSQFSETVVKRKLFSDIQKHFLNPDYPVSKVIWNKKAMRFLESYISGRVLLQIIFRERSYLRWFSLLSYVRRKLKM